MKFAPGTQVRDQGVGGSNPLSPTNLSLAFSIVYAATATSAFSVHFGTFGTTEGQLEAETTPFSPLLAKLNVLFDLVVEVAHVLACMSQPLLVETFGTVGVVPQESVSETPKRMVPSFMRSGERIDVAQFLKGLVQMAADDV